VIVRRPILPEEPTMFQHPTLHRRRLNQRNIRRTRLDLLELERRDQPALLGLPVSALPVELFSGVRLSAPALSAELSVSISAVSMSNAQASAVGEQISMTEIVGPSFTVLVVTFTPAAMPTTPGSGAGTSVPTPSVPAPSAGTTPIAAPPAQETTAGNAGASLRGTAASPTTVTPFVIVPESAALVRGGGPTNDTVAPRTTGPTTVVLGPPTATILSAGGLGGVIDTAEAAANAPLTTSTSAKGPSGPIAPIPTSPPALVQPGTTAGGDVQPEDVAAPVTTWVAGKIWLKQHRVPAALAAVAAIAGGYGVIRWRRSRVVKQTGPQKVV
jgi:hypothetical protein